MINSISAGAEASSTISEARKGSHDAENSGGTFAYPKYLLVVKTFKDFWQGPQLCKCLDHANAWQHLWEAPLPIHDSLANLKGLASCRHRLADTAMIRVAFLD